MWGSCKKDPTGSDKVKKQINKSSDTLHEKYFSSLYDAIKLTCGWNVDGAHSLEWGYSPAMQ